MIVSIHQPQFLPYLGFFHKVAHSDLLVHLDDVQFLERGHQHRNEIKMQTGKQWLTVPVVQQRGQTIDQVVIDTGTNWRRKQWAALESNYRPAPFFKELAPGLKQILLEGTQTRLLDLDLDLLHWAFEVLELRMPTRRSSELQVSGTQTERLVSICQAVGATVYLSGQGGRLYMELALFEAAGIEVRFQEFHAPSYPQLFMQHGFIANLSVVDALFGCGRGARELIAAR
ncbi:MAG: WbqC family protein [Deltaproteobacteria bacterium]|nr:WbqC family protein [Deltaproteobacteria bacterium]